MYVPEKQVELQGRQNLTQYLFGYKLLTRPFCKTCGVHPISEWRDIPADELSAVPEESREYREASLGFCAINLRILDNFSLDGLVINHWDGEKDGAPYINP